MQVELNRIHKFVTDSGGPTEKNFSEEMENFTSDPDLQETILRYIDKQIQQARKQAEEDQLKRMKAEIQKSISQYVGLVTNIVDYVADACAQIFVKNDIHIVESRSNFDMLTREINIMFIIDADLDSECEFAELVTTLKSNLIANDNIYADLYWINQRNGEIDINAVNADYPARRTDKR